MLIATNKNSTENNAHVYPQTGLKVKRSIVARSHLYFYEPHHYLMKPFPQLLESLIVGVLCFFGMLIFKFPYVMLVSVIIGATNIIPMVGPFIGTVPASFIILMADISEPTQVLWFIVFIIILQQLESNLIYPRVVGSSLGLPGFWVIFAITIGGNFMGLPGIILGVPSAAALYKLIREATYKRLEQKDLKIE